MSLSGQVKKISLNNPMCVRRPGVVGELVLAARFNIFQVVGGDVRVEGMHGKIATAIGANATTVQLFILPAGSVTQQALSAASGNLTGLFANTLLEPTGAVAVAIALEVTFGVGLVYQVTNPWILIPGTINILVGGATTLVGSIDWMIEYRPLSPGAEIL